MPNLRTIFRICIRRILQKELPCILRLLEEIQEGIELAIVDGFVFLKEGRKGLGAHLFESQNGKLPIIGVAKTYFEGCEDYRTVYRGNSVKPLYVSSIGIDLDYAAKLIKSMRGTYRIPDMLRKVDHLTRFEA